GEDSKEGKRYSGGGRHDQVTHDSPTSSSPPAEFPASILITVSVIPLLLLIVFICIIVILQNRCRVKAGMASVGKCCVLGNNQEENEAMKDTRRLFASDTDIFTISPAQPPTTIADASQNVYDNTLTSAPPLSYPQISQRPQSALLSSQVENLLQVLFMQQFEQKYQIWAALADSLTVTLLPILVTDQSYEKSISETVHVGRDDLNISCKYLESLRRNPKFLCNTRLQESVCFYEKSVNESGKYINMGKFSLYDDGERQILSVSIRNVTERDAGEYWCGAEAAWESDQGYKVYFTQINLTVTGFQASTVIPMSVTLVLLLIGVIFLSVVLQKRRRTQDLSDEKSISETVHVGRDLNISYKYPESLRSHPKFLCKMGLHDSVCSHKRKVPIKESEKNGNMGKFFLYDDGERRILSVSIRNVTERDAGEYWCGAEAAWESDHGYKVYFTQIILTVDPHVPVSTWKPTQPSSSTLLSSSSSSSSFELISASPPAGFRASTVIPVSVTLALFLIGVIFLIAVLQKRRRMQGTSFTGECSAQDAGNDPE
ncbi:polymeric immunoglobulin receptor-like isoform X4, partial [Clarias magur]